MTDEELEMHEAASNANTYELVYLLASRVDVNVSDENGNTALHEAATPEVVSLLLKYGASVNVQNRVGMTPLHRNIQNDNPGGVKLLLEARANTALCNNSCLPPFHFAITQGNASCVEIMMRHDPGIISSHNAKGLSPIEFARVNGEIQMINKMWQVSMSIATEKKRFSEEDRVSKRQKTSIAYLLE